LLGFSHTETTINRRRRRSAEVSLNRTVDEPVSVLSARLDNATPAAHAVQFYEDDAVLVDALAQFVGAALVVGDAAVVLATEVHRSGLSERLRAGGLDVDRAARQGRYMALDAADALSSIMRDGQPDASRFRDVLGGVIDRAASTVAPRKRVAVFGELVALLCAQGNHTAAVQLEQLWNVLARSHAFSLLCAYPIDAFPHTADGAPFDAVCAAHTWIVPAEDYPLFGDDETQLHEIAVLQQKARALETEVAERAKAETRLLEREAELTDFVEHVPVALHWVGPDGTILWANRAEFDLVGYARDEYVGRHIAGFHADQEVVADILARLARNESLQDYEARLRHKDGSLRYVLINSNVHRQDDEFLHTRCVTQDITERVHASADRARLAAIIESSHDAIIGKTLDGTITSWNRAAEHLYGYSAAEIVGRPIATIVPPERQDELAEIMATIASGQPIAEHETERVRNDGSRVEVSISISPIRDRTGQITGASTIARDLTQRGALERQKQEFLEMVAHDLGSPLTAVQGYAQILQRRGIHDEQMVAKILTEAGRMRRLVADVLDTARLQAGRLELRRASVDLAALARDCAAQAKLVAGGDRLVRVDTGDRPVIGEWDGDRLAQVLANLLDNAIKYAPDGEIVVRVIESSAEARVAVIDRGPGLTSEELQRVFDHFFRAPDAARKVTGAGLGLFISKMLVEAHGGRLWAESVPGRGSTFAFALPYASATMPEAGVDAAAGGRERVSSAAA
jgi:PAS domain S-box-containing protein